MKKNQPSQPSSNERRSDRESDQRRAGQDKNFSSPKDSGRRSDLETDLEAPTANHSRKSTEQKK